MKTFIQTTIIGLMLAIVGPITAQDWPDEYLGLPGDNLNLYAVMDLFQKSPTLEAFERSLNDPEKMINNLDLNDDKLVDYIGVHDYIEGNIHTIVLRIALGKEEFQDVAVFTVQKLNDGSVQIQLIGDEDLYGKDYIVEPIYAETPNPGYKGNTSKVTTSDENEVVVYTTTFYEVADWPIITYIYTPFYNPWRSVWYWGYYPSYWSPWSPHYWHYYYGYHSYWHPHYYYNYRHWRHHRCDYYHRDYYRHNRRYSNTVASNISYGRYRDTYSRPDRKPDGERISRERNPNRDNVVIEGRPNKPIVDRPTRETPVQTRPTGNRVNNTRESNTKENTRIEGNIQNNKQVRRETTTREEKERNKVVTRPNVTSTESTNSSERTESKPARVTNNRPNTESKPRVTGSETSRPTTTERSKPAQETSRPERRVETQERAKPARETSKPERRVETQERSKPARTESSERKSESSERKSSSSSSKSSESKETKKR